MSESNLTPQALAKAISSGIERGFEVIQSGPRVLLLDLDSPFARAQYERVRPVLLQYVDVTGSSHWSSKSGNDHKVIRLAEDMPIRDRIIWQAALGSDGVKEALSLVAINAGVEEPCLLFKPKEPYVPTASDLGELL